MHMGRRKAARHKVHANVKKDDPVVPSADEPNIRDLERANLLVQRRMLIVTCIVALVTTCYVTITLLQYFAFREQIVDARRSADQALRETRAAREVDQR